MTTLDDLQAVAARTIARRQRFVAALMDEIPLTPAQRAPLERILAASSASRFNMYFHYPHLFAPAFRALPRELLDELAFAGRCALDYILLYDCLLDSGQPPDAVLLLSSYAFQRRYLLGLQTLLPPDSDFWAHLARYESEATRALLDEQLRRARPFASSSPEDVRRQAVGKAALSRLAVVALACLSGEPNSAKVHDLIASIDHFNHARQLFDDLLDWRRDYEHRCLSFLLVSALERLGVSSESSPEDYPPAQRVGAMIYTHVAEPLLLETQTVLKKAMAALDRHPASPSWREIIHGMTEDVDRQCIAIREVLELSRSRRAAPATQATSRPAESVDAAVEAARSFILACQAPEGCWRDFATAAGESEDWVTGYVGWCLASSRQLPEAARGRAVSWLAQSQLAEGGWGYHRNVVVDADSTAWSLRFLALAAERSIGLDAALRCLLRHQGESGGFSTYETAEPIRTWMQVDPSQDFSGWCSSQACVTAVATAALLETPTPVPIERVRSAQAYLLAQQRPEGFWHSYWWAGPHYATAHALQVLRRCGALDAQALSQAAQWLLASQLEDGSWSPSPGAEGTPFATALALQGSLAAEDRPQPRVREAVERATTWLLRKQERDGSWRGSALLLLPLTSDLEPWRVARWPIAIAGTGIARRDHRRLFSTATVLQVLTQVREPDESRS